MGNYPPCQRPAIPPFIFLYRCNQIGKRVFVWLNPCDARIKFNASPSMVDASLRTWVNTRRSLGSTGHTLLNTRHCFAGRLDVPFPGRENSHLGGRPCGDIDRMYSDPQSPVLTKSHSPSCYSRWPVMFAHQWLGWLLNLMNPTVTVDGLRMVRKRRQCVSLS